MYSLGVQWFYDQRCPMEVQHWWKILIQNRGEAISSIVGNASTIENSSRHYSKSVRWSTKAVRIWPGWDDRFFDR
jgi:hypothetical protein